MALPAQAETYVRIIAEAEAAGGARTPGIEAARRAWYEELSRGSGRQILPPAGDGYLGRGPCWLRSTTRISPIGAPPSKNRFRPIMNTRSSAGSLGASPVMLQQLALLRGFDLASMDRPGRLSIRSRNALDSLSPIAIPSRPIRNSPMCRCVCPVGRRPQYRTAQTRRRRGSLAQPPAGHDRQFRRHSAARLGLDQGRPSRSHRPSSMQIERTRAISNISPASMAIPAISISSIAGAI